MIADPVSTEFVPSIVSAEPSKSRPMGHGGEDVAEWPGTRCEGTEQSLANAVERGPCGNGTAPVDCLSDVFRLGKTSPHGIPWLALPAPCEVAID